MAKNSTIELGGKTYNLSQINSVYIEERGRFPGKLIVIAWVVMGVLTTINYSETAKSIGDNIAFPLWCILTAASTIIAAWTALSKDYLLIFDMSSGKTTALKGNNKSEVEQQKELIVNAISTSN